MHSLLCCQGWKEHEMMGDAVFIVRECPSSSLRGDKGPITTSTLTDSVWVWGVFLVLLQQLKDFTLSHFYVDEALVHIFTKGVTHSS